MKISKSWQEKAKKFAEYVRDDYNKDRHILATLGSAGYTFNDDVEMLKESLIFIGENEVADLIKFKRNWSVQK